MAEPRRLPSLQLGLLVSMVPHHTMLRHALRSTQQAMQHSFHVLPASLAFLSTHVHMDACAKREIFSKATFPEPACIPLAQRDR